MPVSTDTGEVHCHIIAATHMLATSVIRNDPEDFTVYLKEICLKQQDLFSSPSALTSVLLRQIVVSPLKSLLSVIKNKQHSFFYSNLLQSKIASLENAEHLGGRKQK